MNDFMKSAIGVITMRGLRSRLAGLYRQRVNRSERQRMYEECNLPLRPCHYRELFINHDGYVYPCCLVWSREHMRIGHIDDPDLFEKIKVFSEYCHCERYKLRPISGEDLPTYELLNIEVSLLCQGKCAMCGVNAPEWRGKYDYYGSLSRLLEKINPARIMIQGGEVLIQKEALEWIEKEKCLHPAIRWWLVTNGNVGEEMAVICRKLFHDITVSIVGFQPETYRVIMGLAVERVKSFVVVLIKQGGVRVALKYLVTPLSLHESGLFFEWAVGTGAASIYFSDSAMTQYVRMDTSDKYWSKIVERTSGELKNLLIKERLRLEEQGSVVEFESSLAKLFNLDEMFITKHGLEKIVVWHKN